MKKLLYILLIIIPLSTQAMTPVGLKVLKSFEGCALVAYKCPAGVWTIGYGSTKGVYPGMRISMFQAEERLIEYLKPMEEKMRNRISRHLPWWQDDALGCFFYNLGLGVLKGELKEDINRDSPNVGKRMLSFNKARDPKTGALRVLNGLTRRRTAEVNLYEKRF